MGIEAFIWNYRDGEPIGFDYGVVRDLLSTGDSQWFGEYGCLQVHFHDPSDSVDIFLGPDAPATNHVEGITIARPINHPEFLRRLFRVMQLGNVMLFYSDETTPIFVRGADARHYPTDLLQELGEPRYVSSPAELPHQT